VRKETKNRNVFSSRPRTLLSLFCTNLLESSLLDFINQSINQSKHISIAPYVASESEAQTAFRLANEMRLTEKPMSLNWFRFRFEKCKIEMEYTLSWPCARDVVLGTRTRTRVQLEYKFLVLVLGTRTRQNRTCTRNNSICSLHSRDMRLDPMSVH